MLPCIRPTCGGCRERDSRVRRACFTLRTRPQATSDMKVLHAWHQEALGTQLVGPQALAAWVAWEVPLPRDIYRVAPIARNLPPCPLARADLLLNYQCLRPADSRAGRQWAEAGPPHSMGTVKPNPTPPRASDAPTGPALFCIILSISGRAAGPACHLGRSL